MDDPKFLIVLLLCNGRFLDAGSYEHESSL